MIADRAFGFACGARGVHECAHALRIHGDEFSVCVTRADEFFVRCPSGVWRIAQHEVPAGRNSYVIFLRIQRCAEIATSDHRADISVV